jgi:hypothetical protein
MFAGPGLGWMVGKQEVGHPIRSCGRYRLSGNWDGTVHNRLVMEGKPTYHSVTANTADPRLGRDTSTDPLLLFRPARVALP